MPEVAHSKVVKGLMSGAISETQQLWISVCSSHLNAAGTYFAQVLLVKGPGTIPCLLEKGCFAELRTLWELGSPPW